MADEALASQLTADVECKWCTRMRMLLAEAGLNQTRVRCVKGRANVGLCGVSAGGGAEGFTYEQVDALIDKAIAILAAVSGD
jgi:hypothetical protein